MQTGSVDHTWKLCGTPIIGFYRKLHTNLPKLSEGLIRRLYSVIYFQEKASRPDNTYRFMDNIVSSKRQTRSVPSLKLKILTYSQRKNRDSDTSFQVVHDVESTFQDIIGHHKYSPEIRKLCYNLLADQVPVSNITDIIRTALKCFNPSMNVEELKLLRKTCASYMRKEELKIITDTHKVHICSDASKGKGMYILLAQLSNRIFRGCCS